MYTKLIRPVLFSLPAELSHRFVSAILRFDFIWSYLRWFTTVEDPSLNTDMAGIRLSNPVGLAAGFDKNAENIGSLSKMGFGYIVIGTVVCDRRIGNPRPRIFRNKTEYSLINSLGFPSSGLDVVADTLTRKQNVAGVPTICSISGISIEEFVKCFTKLQPLSDGIELNISSPNTEGIRAFQNPDNLEELLVTLAEIKNKPMFLKLPPYFDDVLRGTILRLVDLCVRHSVDGVTLVNTIPMDDKRLALGKGGLSGKPLFPHMLRIVKDIRNHAGNRLVINACGGIFSGEDAWEAINAGANTVQLYTGLIYRGPTVVKDINAKLISMAK